MWFEALTGFNEESPDQVRANNAALNHAKFTQAETMTIMLPGIIQHFLNLKP